MEDSFIDMPWRIGNAIKYLIAYPFIRIGFAIHGISWGKNWRIFGMPIIQRHRKSIILLGDGLSMRSWRNSNPLVPSSPVSLSTRKTGAIIKIGSNCGMTGSKIIAAESIEIGNRVMIGANSAIVDTDFHPLDPLERQRDVLNGKHRPVVIENDVFIGMDSIILKGVTIGEGSVIGAGSVVTKDVPSGVIVAGNPVKILKAL